MTKRSTCYEENSFPFSCVAGALSLFGCTTPNETPAGTTGNNEVTLPQGTQETTKPEETEPTAHVHSYAEYLSKEASCTAKGKKVFTCTCGDSYYEEIAKLSHSYTAATCTTPKTCSMCGNTSGGTAKHTYVDNKCSVCGKEKSTEKNLTSGDWLCYAEVDDDLTVFTLSFKNKKIHINSYIAANDFATQDLKHNGRWWSKKPSENHITAPMTEYTESDKTVTVKATLEGQAITLTFKRTKDTGLTLNAISGDIPGYSASDVIGALFTYEN